MVSNTRDSRLEPFYCNDKYFVTELNKFNGNRENSNVLKLEELQDIKRAEKLKLAKITRGVTTLPHRRTTFSGFPHVRRQGGVFSPRIKQDCAGIQVTVRIHLFCCFCPCEA